MTTAAVNHRHHHWRIARWGVAAALLALPAVAMRFTPEVNWTGGDFVAAAVMLGLPLLGYDAVSARSEGFAYRAGAALALLAAFLLVWIDLAVGIVGEGGNRASLMYAGVLALAYGGAIASRLKPNGLARTMLIVAVAQVAAPVVAVVGAMGSDGPIWPWDAIGVTAVLATLWLSAAALFRRAARA